jgi:Rod binding domain-containing protein
MRETVPKDGLFEQGFSSEVYTEMLDQEYARSLSENGGIGLAEVLERQFIGEDPSLASSGLMGLDEDGALDPVDE